MRRNDVARRQDNPMPRPLRILARLGLFDEVDHRAPAPPLRHNFEKRRRLTHAA